MELRAGITYWDGHLDFALFAREISVNCGARISYFTNAFSVLTLAKTLRTLKAAGNRAQGMD